MEVTGLNTNNNSSSASQVQDASALLNPTGMGRDDFLKLLIEQMKNQDPLNPMENQDFASQLAQFSSLEELRTINNNLDQGVQIDMLLAQAVNNTMSANFVGKSLKAIGNTIEYSGEGQATLAFRPESDVDRIKFTIKNEAGTVVRTIEVENYSATDSTFQWDGKNSDGEQLAAGKYTFEAEGFDDKNNPITVNTFVVGTITGVRYENGNTVLVCNGEEISFSRIIEISQGGTQS